MKSKPSFFSAFSRIFLQVPVLAGIALALILLTATEAFQHLYVAQMLSDISLLTADVFPDPDKIPDGNLPQGSVESEFLLAVINIILALTSTIMLGAMLFAGALFVIHFGDEEKISLAKGIFKWSIAGIIVILVAYSIIQGITQLTFTNPPAA